MSLRDRARETAAHEVAPKAAEIDRRQAFPTDAVASLARAGMLGLTVPEALGGGGQGALSCVLAIEEVASACASTAAILAIQNLLVCDPIVRFGSESQQRAWLPQLARGEALGCFAVTEATGGSSLDGIATTATRARDGWVLRGTKSFVTAAPAAKVALVFATSSVDKSLSAFLVPTGSSGVAIGRPYDKLGLRGAVASTLTFDDVIVPADAVLGGEGKGERVLRFAAEGGRIGAAALAVGIARAAFSASTRYAVSRRSGGQPIAEHQAIQFKLADMCAQIDAARLLTWRAAVSRDEGTPLQAQEAMAKLAASEAATRVASDAVQIFGGNGCLAEYAVERHFRDAKVTEIYEGTSEMHRLGIASQLLKD